MFGSRLTSRMPATRMLALPVLTILVLGAASGPACGQTEITQAVLASGGGSSIVGDLEIKSTLGQAVIGLGTAGEVTISSGYWGGGYEYAAVNEDGVLILPRVFAMRAPAPNPFRWRTVIGFDVPAHQGAVDISVFDVTGRHVRSLFSGTPESGRQTTIWDGNSDCGTPLGTGTYFVVFSAPGTRQEEKVMLLR